MNKLFKGQISFQAVFSKQARDSYYHGILAATGICMVYNHTGYSKADGSSALILNDENGMCAKRISGSDCDITIRQKRA